MPISGRYKTSIKDRKLFYATVALILAELLTGLSGATDSLALRTCLMAGGPFYNIHVIKQYENTRQTPVIIFSANADIKEISKKVNADSYIEKPFTVSTFIEIIQKHIG